MTETDLVIVEDLTSHASNAVVLKGTVVLNFHSPPKVKGTGAESGMGPWMCVMMQFLKGKNLMVFKIIKLIITCRRG